jgi:hypothetical protein
MKISSPQDAEMSLGSRHANDRKRLKTLALIALAIIVVFLPAACQDKPKQEAKQEAKQDPRQDKDQKSSNKSVGFVLSGDATGQEVGLPIYPGAKRRKDTSDESSALKLGLWAGSSGFKLVLLKLVSDDSPEKIAAFYRKALAEYGTVIDCGKPGAKSEKPASTTSTEIQCDDDQEVEAGYALKAGTKQKQHLVAIERREGHSDISLVYLEAPKSDGKED